MRTLRRRRGARALINLLAVGERNPGALMAQLGVGPRVFLQLLQAPSVRRYRRALLLGDAMLAGSDLVGDGNLQLMKLPVHVQDLARDAGLAVHLAAHSPAVEASMRHVLGSFGVRWVRTVADQVPADPRGRSPRRASSSCVRTRPPA